MRALAALFLALLLAWPRPAAADEESPAAETAPLNERDLAVIALMEELALMELAQEMEMIQDMECLTEDDRHEEQE
jgi:hypothetical protein